MIEIQDYIRKLYEQTGVKLKEDDPILIELVAQQIILEEFSTEIDLIIENNISQKLDALKIINRNEKKSLNDISNEVKDRLHNQRLFIIKQNKLLKRNYIHLICLNISIQACIIVIILTLFK